MLLGEQQAHLVFVGDLYDYSPTEPAAHSQSDNPQSAGHYVMMHQILTESALMLAAPARQQLTTGLRDSQSIEWSEKAVDARILAEAPRQGSRMRDFDAPTYVRWDINLYENSKAINVPT